MFLPVVYSAQKSGKGLRLAAWLGQFECFARFQNLLAARQDLLVGHCQGIPVAHQEPVHLPSYTFILS